MINRACILLFVICIQFGQSLQQQQLKKIRAKLKYLGSQITSNSLKTQLEISELRDAIELLTNRTDSPTRSSALPGDVSARDDTAAIAGLESDMKAITDQLEVRIAAISKAVSFEKKNTRQRMKEVKTLAESIANQSTDQIKSDLVKMKQVNSKLEEKVQENTAENVELRQLVIEMRQRIEELENSSAEVPVPVPVSPCPPGWLKFQDTCYLYVKDESAGWHGADIRCIDMGGHLAEPDTEEKMRYLLGAIQKNVWLGATDSETEGTWVWSSSQEPVTFFLWETGQPNSWGGSQNCLEKGNVLLNDEGCSQEQNFVCEKKANLELTL